MAAGFAAAVTAKNPFLEQMKKLQAVKPDQYKLDDHAIEKVAAAHRAAHGYGPEIESMMTQLGYKNPPQAGENVMEYLTRLLHLAQPGVKPVDWQSSTTYVSNVTSEPNWTQQQEAYAEKLKQYEQQKHAKEQQELQWLYQQQYITQTNLPPWMIQNQGWKYGLQPTNPAPYGLPQYTQIQAAPQVIPDDPVAEPEKPKRDLPDPIEPKKRLMKKL